MKNKISRERLINEQKIEIERLKTLIPSNGGVPSPEKPSLPSLEIPTSNLYTPSLHLTPSQQRQLALTDEVSRKLVERKKELAEIERRLYEQKQALRERHRLRKEPKIIFPDSMTPIYPDSAYRDNM